LKGFKTKTISGRRAGGWREVCFLIFYTGLKHALALTALPRGGRMPFFTRNPILNVLLFATSSKKGRSMAKLFIQLLLQFSRVLLVSLGARLCPAEQPYKDVRFGCRSSALPIKKLQWISL
jgi:hypothetical protein